MRSDSEQLAEAAMLGSILIDPRTLSEARIVVTAADFHGPAKAAVYAAMLDLDASGEAIDIITIRRRLERGTMHPTKAGELLASLTDCVPSSANVAYYARIVADASARERVEAAGGRMTEGARVHGRTLEETLGEAERTLADVWASVPNGNVVDLGKCLGEAVSEVAERADTGKGAGLSTGFPSLDRKLGGLRPGEMTVVAGRPGMGKTSLALGIAAAVAEAGTGVLLFSLESSAQRAALTVACARAGLSLHELHRGSARPDDLSRLLSQGERMRTWPLRICDRATLTMDRLWGIAQAHASRGEVGLVVVDYLQLMDGCGRENRQQEVSSLSRGLKRLAMSLRLPVVALSSLNRGVEHDRDKRPRLAHLRESGAIEQDADAVLLLYRDEEYDPESKDKGVCEVGIAKNRTGPCGIVKLAYAKAFMRFAEL